MGVLSIKRMETPERNEPIRKLEEAEMKEEKIPLFSLFLSFFFFLTEREKTFHPNAVASVSPTATMLLSLLCTL